MPSIDDYDVPDLLKTATEMARSLRIGLGYLRRLEGEGLPFFEVEKNKHVYDPIEVWKWFRLHIKHNGGVT